MATEAIRAAAKQPLSSQSGRGSAEASTSKKAPKAQPSDQPPVSPDAPQAPKEPLPKEKDTADLPEEDLRQLLRLNKSCPLPCAQQAALELQAEFERRAAARHEAKPG